MVSLALDPNAPIDFSGSYWTSVLARVPQPYFTGLGMTPTMFSGLPGGINPINSDAVVLVHPIWDVAPANYHPALAAAIADAQSRGFTPVPKSIFRATRFPYE
jgi:DEAD/DEAH box helicase domain-containing protein